MLILFLKATEASQDDSDQEPLPDKMRRILRSHVDEAKTDEERERAEGELRKFTRAD
ncbi:hypothetical protein IF803_35115 [Bradyrhizobium sp. UFLA06-06]